MRESVGPIFGKVESATVVTVKQLKIVEVFAKSVAILPALDAHLALLPLPKHRPHLTGFAVSVVWPGSPWR